RRAGAQAQDQRGQQEARRAGRQVEVSLLEAHDRGEQQDPEGRRGTDGEPRQTEVEPSRAVAELWQARGQRSQDGRIRRNRMDAPVSVDPWNLAASARRRTVAASKPIRW